VTSPADKLNLELLRRSDAGEFTRFVHQHEVLVLGLCQSLGLNATDCDDAAAETFAVAYSGLKNFRGDAELSTWLYRIAWRMAMKVRRRYPAVPEDRGERTDASMQAPLDAAATRETHEAVWRAVAALEPEQAAAVELYYRRGMSVEEIAAIMEKPAGSIKTLLFRARERLRFLLRTCGQTK